MLKNNHMFLYPYRSLQEDYERRSDSSELNDNISKVDLSDIQSFENCKEKRFVLF